MSLNANATSGLGITLSYGIVSGGTTTFTPLFFLQDDCDFEGFENAIIEIKTLASGYVTKIVGRTDSGSFNGTSYLINEDAGVTFLWNQFTAKTSCPWQLMLNDGSTPTVIATGGTTITLGSGTNYVFNGPVAELTPGNFTGEDSPNFSFSIAISNQVVKTLGT